MDFFIELLENIWDKIKKFFVKVLNFGKNIVNYFKNPQRLQQLITERELIAVSIKENLENGQYKVVNCLFNTEENEIVDIEDTEGISAEEIDNATEESFGDKPMIIVQ